MKVYVVTTGEYSSYIIDTVFLNRKKAETYVAIKNRDEFLGYTYRIETYESEDDNIEIRTDKKVWRYIAIYDIGAKRIIRIDKPLRIFEKDYEEITNDVDDRFFYWVSCILDKRDDKQAKKILEDKVAEYKAKKERIC